MRTVLAVVALLPALAMAGGSNYTIVPGVSSPSGKVSEWAVPTPRFARDPAAAPDGRIYIAVMHGNKLARFDPATRQFEEWDLPEGTRPHGLVVDEKGTVWMTGHGNGTLLEIPFADGKPVRMTAHKTPSGGTPHTIIFDGREALWFTNQGADKVTRYERASGRMTEFDSRDGPYGLAMDKSGNVWFCQASGQRVGRIDAKTGKVTEIDFGKGSLPRRIAAAPDDTLWVARYGDGKLTHIDARSGKIIKSYEMPAGPSGNPYAVTVDGAGKVWANEIGTDTVTLFDPASEKFRVFDLPTKNEGIRKMVVDAKGRLWYMGSHSGKLGVVE
ncbi:Vgb family protein [Noviherbaspirillum galbum]|uniref:PQQ-binding-like beta-propeller repeat protein n=1 Tax=Noviherbaspirillum galbum TaxID=2709383 RepID=A0A6B3SVQ8_9BURK|nr:PQQ-binding-like beta-propeller repeat protein [Noviherbaspirillum galbum]NEX63475.1 PQQ-binding-like beta-propeller repeat protein [Noviherbaspirillum galbum]